MCSTSLVCKCPELNWVVSAAGLFPHKGPPLPGACKWLRPFFHITWRCQKVLFHVIAFKMQADALTSALLTFKNTMPRLDSQSDTIHHARRAGSNVHAFSLLDQLAHLLQVWRACGGLLQPLVLHGSGCHSGQAGAEVGGEMDPDFRSKLAFACGHLQCPLIYFFFWILVWVGIPDNCLYWSLLGWHLVSEGALYVWMYWNVTKFAYEISATTCWAF